MECSPALIRMAVIIVGLVLAIVGMLGYTGLIGWAVPRAAMFVGWGLILAGIVAGDLWAEYDDEEGAE